jgi:hypothetical protein
MTNYGTFILLLIVAVVPVSAILSAAWALYDWLISRLPKNVQAVMITHEAQIRSIITTVVDAVEQSMPGESGKDKKAAAVAQAEDIFNNLPLPKSIPKPSPALVNALIEQMVAYLPKKKPLYTEPAKSVSTSNSFNDAMTQATTVPLPTVSAVGAVPSPLDAPIPNGAL